MSNETATPETKDRPKEYTPVGRPISEIIKDLSKEVPPSMLRTKTLKGKDITFIPWYNATRLLDAYAPGWTYEIKSIQPIGGKQICVVVALTIPADEGDVTRDATGIEDDEVDAYGDPTSNAESMALRRAAAKFGLGRYLYNK